MIQASYPFLKPHADAQALGAISHFRVIRLLGEGGMGFVFEAVDERLHRTVALKIIKPHLAEQDEGESRFLREARSLAAVRHPHVATIFEIGVDNEVPFLAMERLFGQTLEDRLAYSEPLTIEEILRIGAEVSDGLKAIHGAGLVHRDIKPANIWLEQGTSLTKVIDFGLAQTDVMTARKKSTTSIAGTPHYMSPEQARGEPLTEQSDLYSLGVILYRALSNKLPHEARDPLRQLAAIVALTPKPLMEQKKDLPQRLCLLVDNLLSKNPKDRVASSEYVRGELIAIRDERLAFRQARSSLSLLRQKFSRFLTSPVTLATTASVLFPAAIVFAATHWIWSPTLEDETSAVTVETAPKPAVPNFSPAIRHEVQVPLMGQTGKVFGITNRPKLISHEPGLVPILNQAGGAQIQRLAAMAIELNKADLPHGKCVDASLWLTYVPRGQPTQSRQFSVFGKPIAKDFDLEQLDFNTIRQWKNDGEAIAFGNWDFPNEVVDISPIPKTIPFTTNELIRFVRKHANEKMLFWIERVDPSIHQANFVAQSNVVSHQPRIDLVFAEIASSPASVEERK